MRNKSPQKRDNFNGDDVSDDSSAFETIDLTDSGDTTVEFTVSREVGFDNTVGFYSDRSNDPAIYFDSAAANSSNFDHIRSSGSNTFEYEDLPNGMNDMFNDGTPDYNDMIVEYDFV